MDSDEQTALHAEALGILAALAHSAAGIDSRNDLLDAYASLETICTGTAEPPAPAEVGTHRRAADFASVQGKLMQLSSSAGVDRDRIARTMMLVTRAESHWVSPPSSLLSRARSRLSDAVNNSDGHED